MKPACGGGCSLASAVRRSTVPSRYGVRNPAHRRSKSSLPSSASSASSATGSSSTSASLAAGASIPSVPETHPLRRLIQSSVIGRLATRYSRVQNRRPYWTQFWSTLVIYLCGDLTAQLLFSGETASEDEDGCTEESSTSVWRTYDPLRTVRHLTVGAVASIPVYKWFMFLHNNFNFASSRVLSIVTKVTISQCVFTPTFNTYFFSAQSLLAGATVHDTVERLKVAVPTSLINSAKFWPAVTAFMFAYVDPQFRSIFSGVIAVGWQSYLSWLNQKAEREVRNESQHAEDGSSSAVPVSPVQI